MNFGETEDAMLDEVKVITDIMYANCDDEAAAFEKARQHVSSLPPEYAASVLALTLMSLAANAMTTNERIQNLQEIRGN